MKKRLFRLCALGACVGVTISVTITLIISAVIGDGNYYPVPPQLIRDCGTELTAVLVQLAGALLYGGALAGASVIWSVERWSLLRQTLTHLLVCSAATLPAAWGLYWMPHSIRGILEYFGIFFALYLLIWTVTYGRIKRQIRQFNEKIGKAPARRPFEGKDGGHPYTPSWPQQGGGCLGGNRLDSDDKKFKRD